MHKIHTISIENFKEDPIVVSTLASSTGPTYKKLFVKVNLLTNIVDYSIMYKDDYITCASLENAIEIYNSK